MISPNATLYCSAWAGVRMELRRSSAPPEAKSYSPAKKPVDLIACWMYLARSTAPAWSGYCSTLPPRSTEPLAVSWALRLLIRLSVKLALLVYSPGRPSLWFLSVSAV